MKLNAILNGDLNEEGEGMFFILRNIVVDFSMMTAREFLYMFPIIPDGRICEITPSIPGRSVVVGEILFDSVVLWNRTK